VPFAIFETSPVSASPSCSYILSMASIRMTMSGGDGSGDSASSLFRMTRFIIQSLMRVSKLLNLRFCFIFSYL